MSKAKKMGLAVAVSVGLLGTTAALAANRLVSPTSVRVTHRLGQIVKTSSSDKNAHPHWVKADVTVDYQCPSGEYLVEHSLVTPHQGRMYAPLAKRKARSANNVTYKGVKLVTADQAEKACASKSRATVNVTVTARGWCFEKNIGFDEPGAKPSKSYTIPVRITCKRDLIRANVQPSRWTHRCPAGYSIEGTGKRSMMASKARPKTCVRDGVIYR